MEIASAVAGQLDPGLWYQSPRRSPANLALVRVSIASAVAGASQTTSEDGRTHASTTHVGASQTKSRLRTWTWRSPSPDFPDEVSSRTRLPPGPAGLSDQVAGQVHDEDP